jgi:four helix bundle protein
MRRFEDFRIYQQGRELVRDIYRLTRETALRTDRALTDQMRRAAVSIVSNIAEGAERGGDREFRQYLTIALGSCGELRAQVTIACDVGFISGDQHQEFYRRSQELSWMIAAMRGRL